MEIKWTDWKYNDGFLSILRFLGTFLPFHFWHWSRLTCLLENDQGNRDFSVLLDQPLVLCLPCIKKFFYIYIKDHPLFCGHFWDLNPKPVATFSITLFPSCLVPNHLDFICHLTFWLCQPSLLYPPVSCLIIKVSVCLRGAPQYLLIKACVCVCLFISGCYSRRSPGALMRHKPPLPTEAYTVSCHCTSSHSKHCQNEILSLATSVALGGCLLSCLPVFLYINVFLYMYIIIHLLILTSISSPQFLREIWCNERHARGCSLLPSFLFFVLCFPLYTQYSCVYVSFMWALFPCDHATYPIPKGCRRNPSGVGKEMLLNMTTSKPRGPERSAILKEQQ